MIMWFRLAGALAVTLAALGVLDYWGFFLGERPAEQTPAAAHRSREFFWFLIFLVVMATALLAAARRWTDQLRRVPAAAIRLVRR
jgi:hypothetical protein